MDEQQRPVVVMPDKIIMRRIDDLVEYEKNAKLHPPEQVVKIVASIREFGFTVPLLVDADGVLIAGHGRVEAARQVGLDELPTICLDHLTPDQVRAYRLADNRLTELGGWDEVALADELRSLSASEDFDETLTGWDEDEISGLLEPDDVGGSGGTAERRKAPAAMAVDTVPQICQPGDLWVLGRHRVLCGDCTDVRDVERLFDGESPDSILTDPPYSSGGFQEAGRTRGSKGTDAEYKPIINDRLSTRGYMALLKQCLGLVREAAVLYCFTDWRMWVNTFDVAESSGYGVRSMIVWDKGAPGMGMGWRMQHELILCGTRANGMWARHMGAQGNVIQAARSGNNLHATEKPLDLVAVLLDTTPFALRVYDPFAGSGTTLMAAEQLGRASVNMEMDPAYCDVMLHRWKEYGGAEPQRFAAPEARDLPRPVRQSSGEQETLAAEEVAAAG